MTGRHLTEKDLRNLLELALEEHESFFRRNPHLKSAYYHGLVSICLCQGGALHYLNPGSRLEDFDIWYFYWVSKRKRFPYRAHSRSVYKGKRIDFLKRAVPKERQNAGGPGNVTLEYLKQKDTRTKRELLRKAVIGLFPSTIFSEVLWRGEITEVR